MTEPQEWKCLDCNIKFIIFHDLLEDPYCPKCLGHRTCRATDGIQENTDAPLPNPVILVPVPPKVRSPKTISPSMTEAQFQAKVIRFLKEQGVWLIKYWGGSQFTKAGIPDLLCCVNGYFVAVELKTEKGLTAKLQDYNIDLIRKSGGTAMILRPADFEKFKSFVKEVKKCPRLNLVIPG